VGLQLNQLKNPVPVGLNVTEQLMAARTETVRSHLLICRSLIACHHLQHTLYYLQYL
jgi:hypothetical protein